MKKLHLLNMSRRRRYPWMAVLFCLTACGAGASLFAKGEAVVSHSPLGTSRLSWVKPSGNAETPFTKVSAEPEVLSLDAAADDDLFLTESGFETEPETEVTSPPVADAKPIRQVRLIEQPSAETDISLAPLMLAMTDETSPSVAPTRNETRLQNLYADECPDPHKMASIQEMSYKVTISPGELPQSCPVPDEPYVRKLPTPIVFTWKASALCHKPLYFEDVQLERYGHTFCPLIQPAVSGARFWLTIPILPYLMGTYPPTECVYDLGYYRPGSCAPNMIQPLPISLRGGLIEAGVIVGVAAAIP
ncbi:MAG: hypothetical protein ACOX6D_05475 [Thermoguttaceae bacterium]|jgi:hypothetical protein